MKNQGIAECLSEAPIQTIHKYLTLIAKLENTIHDILRKHGHDSAQAVSIDMLPNQDSPLLLLSIKVYKSSQEIVLKLNAGYVQVVPDIVLFNDLERRYLWEYKRLPTVREITA